MTSSRKTCTRCADVQTPLARIRWVVSSTLITMKARLVMKRNSHTNRLSGRTLSICGGARSIRQLTIATEVDTAVGSAITRVPWAARRSASATILSPPMATVLAMACAMIGCGQKLPQAAELSSGMVKVDQRMRVGSVQTRPCLHSKKVC